MAAAQPPLLVRPVRRAQPVQPVPADGLQQPVAGQPVGGLHPAQYRLLDQPGEQVQYRLLEDVLGRAQLEGAGEHRQPLPQRLFARRAQLEVPVEGRVQAPVPGRYGVPRRQVPEVLTQPGRQLPERERTQLGRGQLDGQWQPVELAADLRHGRPVLGVEGEPRRHGGGPLDEQGHARVPRLGAAVVRLPLLGYAQRRHVPDVLGGHPEHPPAGTQHPQPRRRAQRPVGERRAFVDEVLAVVQDQQHLPVPDMLEEGIGQRPFGRPDPEFLGDRVVQEGGLGHGGQVDHPDPVGECPTQFGGRPYREPALAAATGPGQGDQPGAGQEPSHLGDVGPPADQAGYLSGDSTESLAGATSSGHRLLGTVQVRTGPASLARIRPGGETPKGRFAPYAISARVRFPGAVRPAGPPSTGTASGGPPVRHARRSGCGTG